MMVRPSTALLALAMTALFTPPSDSSAQADATAGAALKEVAPFPVGNAIWVKRYQKDGAMRDLLLTHFDRVTANNEMKMHFIARRPGKLSFRSADRVMSFARRHDLRVFGHALIWHSATPDWVKELGAKDPQALDAFMKRYIQTYVGRYRGEIDGWDVVNEAMNTSGPGYRESIWYQALGKEYIAKAFRYAHEADPDATLFYNDFNIERDGEKLDTALEMIAELQADGVPISGLGFQMHIRMDISNDVIEEALRKGAATGLQIHLSEVDIIFNRHDDSFGGGEQIYDEVTDEMLAQQGDKYRQLVEIYRRVVPEEQQYGITFWGFNDGDSWIRGFFDLQDWPCLFDDELQPKPAFFGFREGLGSQLED
ncbi:endo-1,4-beta-xylanase [Pelagicoccus sp. SDUM812003]|uniref:endo-1,4-beta-xylanase n=1 Tax=Pelagicoccus sp. SDUM812003 TaxID=3041267 RepID=UPI00280F6D07|nr:endo-1,4-beta-xylanase [Pelagicoccus sp. SDUM812003]MDQ8205221.1 endo-1,4-beta-xylanase [Pelagicoccus sp. SDUM812003]